MRFSIVIPTRNRAAYLRHCLITCLAQDEPADEIVVCDNSTPEHATQTAQTVADLANDRVTYLPPPSAPLNMTDNWNRAITSATGDYLTVLGDDDAILPACVRIARICATRYDFDAFRWGWAFYYWPCFRYRGLAGRGFTPLPDNSDSVVVRRVHCLRLLQGVVNGRVPYVELPMLYNSFVHRRVIAALSTDGAAPLDALSPDIYSGIAVAASARHVIATEFPLAIAGQSSASNGAAFENQDSKSEIAKDFLRLNETQRIGAPRGTVAVGKLSLGVTDAFVRFRERYPARVAHVYQRPRALAAWQANDLGAMDREVDPASRNQAGYLDLVKHFKAVPFSARTIRRAYAAGLSRNTDGDIPTPGVHSQQLFFEGSTFQAEDIGAVAKALGSIVGSPRHVVPGWRLKPFAKRILSRWCPPILKDALFALGRRLGIDPGNK